MSRRQRIHARKRGGRILVSALAVVAIGSGMVYARVLHKPPPPSGIVTPARTTTSVMMAAPGMANQPRLSLFQQKVLAELRRQAQSNIRYQDDYFRGGEPPANIGVCTDVVIRAFRAAGVNLQAEVAADIRAHPKEYPVSKPDPNIDHRRCRNLVVFFRRHAQMLPTSGANADWQPGDVVFWDTGNRGIADHVGMTASERDSRGDLAVVHHWPGTVVSETGGLNGWTVRRHFRWPQPKSASKLTSGLRSRE